MTSTFNLPFFEKHIVDVTRIETTNPAVLVTNVVLAILLTMVMGLVGNLIEGTGEEPQGQVQRANRSFGDLPQALRRLWIQLGGKTLARSLFWVGTPIKLATLFLVCGLVLAFLDPALDLRDTDGWMLVLALASAVAIVCTGVLLTQRLILRQTGQHIERQVRAGRLLLVLVTTTLSRLVGFGPGVLVAGWTGYETRKNPDLKFRLSLAAIGAMVVIATSAWGLAPFVDTDAWFKTVALLTFAVAIQTLFFEMLPLKSLHGRTLFERNRLAWLALFGLTALVLLQTMLNPGGSFLSAFQSPTMIIFALVVVALTITSMILVLPVYSGKSTTKWY